MRQKEERSGCSGADPASGASPVFRLRPNSIVTDERMDYNPSRPLFGKKPGSEAACVTGLVVVDTATHWSFFGQAVILLLIQVGGLRSARPTQEKRKKALLDDFRTKRLQSAGSSAARQRIPAPLSLHNLNARSACFNPFLCGSA